MDIKRSLSLCVHRLNVVVAVVVVVVVVDYACLLNLNGDSVRVWYGSKLD